MNTQATAMPLPALQEPASAPVPSLSELLGDVDLLLVLLGSGATPQDLETFDARVDSLLGQFERHATAFGKPTAAVMDAKYAVCALLDETILSSGTALAERWARAPLQLRHFGEHLAGEGFFQRLERLRLDPQRQREVLEVYLRCLLLGFKGKYLLEGEELLKLLKHRLRQELMQAKGGPSGFAPFARPTFRVTEFIRHELPLWVFFALLAAVGLGVFALLQWLLHSRLERLAG